MRLCAAEAIKCFDGQCQHEREGLWKRERDGLRARERDRQRAQEKDRVIGCAHTFQR